MSHSGSVGQTKGSSSYPVHGFGSVGGKGGVSIEPFLSIGQDRKMGIKKKDKINRMALDFLSPASKRPRQALSLPQNQDGYKYEGSCMGQQKHSLIANGVILKQYRKLGRRQGQGQKIAEVAADLVSIMGLQVANPHDKVEVAKAISAKDFDQKQAKKKPLRVAAPAPANDREAQIRAFYASWEWKRLSYDVKIERGRKCECCGAKAPDVRIHTDHVKPIRHHWHLRLERSNLQVLCEDCNMGKGSRDETDFCALNGSTLQELDQEPGLSKDETERLLMIREQLRLN